MRRALKIEPTQIINPLLTGKSMRDLTSTYLRHTIRRPIRPNIDPNLKKSNQSRARQNAAEYFFIFCR
jgi:hypothetical protein